MSAEAVERAASPTVSARAEAVRSGVKSHPAAAAPPRGGIE